MHIPFQSPMYYANPSVPMLNPYIINQLNPFYNTNGPAGSRYGGDLISQKAKKSQTADSTKTPEKQPTKRNKKKIELKKILFIMYWMNQNTNKE